MESDLASMRRGLMMSQNKFVPEVWSNQIWDAFNQKYVYTNQKTKDVDRLLARQRTERNFLDMMTQRQEQVTNAVKDWLRTHMHESFEGPVGDKIIACLTEVREFHWEDHKDHESHWGYELDFVIDGSAPITLRKQFTLNKLVTETKNIPYIAIMNALHLTDDELALLATGV